MNDSSLTIIPLDEQVWRAWVHKGRLREQARARRRWKVVSILTALALMALAIFFLTART